MELFSCTSIHMYMHCDKPHSIITVYLKPLSARFDRVTCEDESEREREKERTGERRIFFIVTITIVSCHLRLFVVVGFF